MNPRHPLYPWLLALLCLSLLARGGIHLHLCLDGAAAPLTVHVSAADTDHHFLAPPHLPTAMHSHDSHGDAQPAHQDVEVALPGELLLKPTKVGLDLTLFAGAVLLILLYLVRRPLLTPHLPPLFRSRHRLLRPPLRGPPLSTSR